MKKKEFISYFILAVFLFSLLNVPHSLSHRFRCFTIARTHLFGGSELSDEKMDRLRLEIENRALKEQIGEIHKWLQNEERIEQHIKTIEAISEDKYSDFNQRRLQSLTNLLKSKIYSIEAKVIFRDPALWSNGFWVDVGQQKNQEMGKNLVAKNSPVILGTALVGVVEEVEQARSYVRLITDAALTPAVRAIRGSEQNQMLASLVTHLLEQLKLRADLSIAQEGLDFLTNLDAELRKEGVTHYLAKGELAGSNYPLWRCLSNTLKGSGFNYEFADKEGHARELHIRRQVPLLNVGDLLITSGLDGVFPEGLQVAHVSKISPLKEGGSFYDLEAQSVIPNLNELTHVQIIPPIPH